MASGNGHAHRYDTARRAAIYRNPVWDQIARRIPPRSRRRSRIVGLFAASRADLEAATVRGFNPNQMIGVERKPEIAQRMRRLGIPTIEACLADYLEQRAEPVDVLIGDFCGTMSPVVYRVLTAIRERSPGCVVALNLLHGRGHRTLLDPRILVYEQEHRARWGIDYLTRGGAAEEGWFTQYRGFGHLPMDVGVGVVP